MTEDAKILVVDDEPIVCLSLANWLEEENYRPKAVEDGASAIAAVREENWDIVLLDLKMPGMDGLEVLRNIKSIAPQTTVIMMTAYASVPSSVQAMKEGAYDYIIKPLDVVIRETIEYAIARCGGSIPKAAAALTVSPSTLYRRIQSWETEAAGG